MGARDSPQAKADLKAKLRQWMRVTHLFAARREGRFKVHPEHYKTLHHNLLHTVSEVAAGAAPPQQTMYRDLHETLTPWVNVKALTVAERDILFHVLDECDAVRRALRGRRMPENRRVWVVAVLIAAGLAIGIALVLWDPDARGNTVSHFGVSLRNWLRWTYATFVGASLHRQLIFGGSVAVVVTMVVVWYSARKY
ncbi:MAG: hypothetical protein ACYTG0_26055 [Planctomycetota bacterium]|jgi:hypothetical protein